jgi:hypothetical protein
MFSRLVSFHFVQNHADPIDALKTELEKTDASDSLLVLPEAFNLGHHYSRLWCELGTEFFLIFSASSMPLITTVAVRKLCSPGMGAAVV